MEYRKVDQFLRNTGLAGEPAFDNLHFINEKIVQDSPNKTILGLYYPTAAMDANGYVPPSTIHHPPEGSFHTMLHELGHRVGHFYHNDISEPFAEQWRISHEYLNPEPEVVPYAVPVAKVCHGCPELEEGRALCSFCAACAPAARAVQQASTYVPSTAKLVASNDYSAAGSYSGEVQEAIGKVTINLPDQLFNVVAEAQTLYNEYSQQVVQNGEQPIHIEVWVDTSPTFSTDFYLVMTATMTQPVQHAVAQAWLPWLVILGVLAVIAFLVAVAAYTIVHTESFIVKAPAAAIGTGVIVLAAAGIGLLALAIWKGTSVKQAVVGPAKRLR